MSLVVDIKSRRDSAYSVLHAIYARYRVKHRENPDSKQMCCMWSTDDPPDEIGGTDPLCDIEAAFDIRIGDDDALDLYDMTLAAAVNRLIDIRDGVR